MKGLFIPDEILKKDGLTTTEKMVLSVYKYYTENGKYKCCSMTCEQVADELNISVWYINKIKKHLKELGYIRASGIKVTYLGVKDCTIVQSKSVLEYKESVPEYKEDCTIVQSKSVLEYRHKKEKEIKKEIKKEMSEKKTNLDLLLDKLPEDYKTPETIDFIKTNYLDRINELDLSDVGKVESYVVSLKSLLLNNFIIYHKINKPVLPERKTDDDFMF